MPSESKFEPTLEGPESEAIEPASTSRYESDPLAIVVEGNDSPAPVGDSLALASENGSSRGRQPFVPVREQKTIISKRPPSASSGSPFGPPVSAEIGDCLVGQMLDHFELVEFVGGGGMGAVFRAIDTHLGRDVAVKVLSRDQNDEETIRRFKNEAQSAARLDHPNIARVYFVGEALGWNYIVFEFIEGANIRDLIAQRGEPLPLEEAILYVLQVAQAIEHASQRDVVHRDIKPSNILITPQRTAKLVDMGLARLHQVESPDHDLTASGVTLGTFDYISPEQARDPRSADVRSDLYSLGCTFYYMLTGRPPFPEGTVLQKLLSHTSDEPPDVRLYRPELPEEIADILVKLLAKNPRQRYQRPDELIAHLIVIADQHGWPELAHDFARGAPVWVPAPETPLTRFEKFLPVILPVFLLVVLVVILEMPWRAKQAPLEPPPPRLAESPSAGASEVDRSADDARVKKEGSAARQPTNPRLPVPENVVDKPPRTNEKSAGGPGPSGEAATASPSPRDPGDAGDSAAKNQGASSPNTDASTTPVKSGDATRTASGAPPTSIERTAGSTAGAQSEPTAGKTGQPAVVSPRVEGGNPTGDAASGARASGVERPPTDAVAASSQPRSDAATPKRTAPGPETRRLIVGPAALAPPGDEAFVVGTLAAACRYAADLPKLEAIELWFDGPRVEPPLAINARRLAIRAGEGFSPMLVIRPPAADSAGDSLIRLSGGDFSFSGIHLWCESPTSGYGGWSMFELDRVVSLDLADCTVTLRNADERGRDRRSLAAFFAIRPPPLRDPVASEMSGMTPDGAATSGGMAIAGMPTTSGAAQGGASTTSDAGGMATSPGGMATSGMAEEGAAYGPTAIRLSRTMVRGEATLVLAEQAQPFSLQWSQGLFISNRRLLEIGAATRKPEWGAPIEVDLSQVTVFAALGLALIKSNSDAMYPLPFNLDARYCIFIADPSSPFIEHRGPHQQGAEPTLTVTGIDNFYSYGTASVYWRRDDGTTTEDELIDRRDPKWCAEMNPQRRVQWASPPDPGMPMHMRHAADYLISRDPKNSAARTGGAGGLSGFSPELLPEAPAAP